MPFWEIYLFLTRVYDIWSPGFLIRKEVQAMISDER